ncbi:MAG: chemotaxis protein CheW [Halothece sp. Uz-M2-17]|nr:chemotaxis protein CheW [Halothece sp. Uz-M2-17]
MAKDYFQITVRQSLGLLIPISETVEVVTCLRKEICPIPGVVPPLRGVLNQRGRLLWIFGLGDALNLPQTTKRRRAQDQLTVVILSSQTEANIRLGAVVSSLQGIITLSEAAFGEVPSQFRPQARRFLTGITTVNERKTALVDTASIFQYLQQTILSV